MPRVATIAVAVVAAVVLTVVLTRPDGGSGANSEVFLQAAASSGPDPYTESTARKSSPPATASPQTPLSTAPSDQANATRGVQGSAPGLYGGTRNVASCDVEKQITSLTADPDKNRAFASVQDIAPSAVPGYLRSLTPVQLRMDTRVTNHGYKNGSPTSYQAVLQTGTAVLVDDRGVPRVRCACGNPLLPPVAQKGTPRPRGDTWDGYRPSNVVVVAPSVQVINVFIMFDPESEDWFSRGRGDTGGGDKKTQPPVTDPSPSADTSSPSPDDPSPSACPSLPGSGSPTPTPEDPAGTCPPVSESPSTEAPSTVPPESDDATEPPPPETPESAPPPDSPAGQYDTSGQPASPYDTATN